MTRDRLTIAGTRVALRRLSMDDCTPRYVDWLRDPDVNRYLETRWVEQTIESVRSYVAAATADDSGHLLAIIETGSMQHIGNIKIGPVIAHHDHADLSYFIGEKSLWGRGYATEAIRLATRIGFERLGLHRLQAGLYAGNISSARALERAGYLRDAVFKDQLAGSSGWEDHVWYRAVRGEWHPAR